MRSPAIIELPFSSQSVLLTPSRPIAMRQPPLRYWLDEEEWKLPPRRYIYRAYRYPQPIIIG